MTQTKLAAVSVAPASVRLSAIAWARDRLFSSPLNILLTALAVWLLLFSLPAFIDWAVFKANIHASTGQQCREIATVLLLGVIILSGFRRFWNFSLIVMWTIVLVVVAVLMWGGVFGLTYIENSLWGGLPLTLMLATFGIALAFPLGVVLALGRRSKMPAIKSICVVYIELIRGVPLISLLFMASVMLPLFLPEGFTIDKLLRALIAIVLFAAAYIAETVRGGLQSIPKGQYEGAESLGLGYWQQMRLVILPQALKVVIPPLVGIFIAMFKDTSLVVIIGIFDLTLAAKAALTDQVWRGFSVEVYLFISVIYFVFCFSMSRYSQLLEQRLATGYQR